MSDEVSKNDLQLAQLLVYRMGFKQRANLLGFLTGALIVLDQMPEQAIQNAIAEAVKVLAKK